MVNLILHKELHDTANDLLYVADSKNDRIQVFDLNSEPAILTPEKPVDVDASHVSPTSIILTWVSQNSLKSFLKLLDTKLNTK